MYEISGKINHQKLRYRATDGIYTLINANLTDLPFSLLLPDEVLAVLLDELEGLPLLDGGDLDELRDAVAHVLLRQRPQEVEVEDDAGVRVEGADPVLVLPGQVAANLHNKGCQIRNKMVNSSNGPAAKLLAWSADRIL